MGSRVENRRRAVVSRSLLTALSRDVASVRFAWLCFLVPAHRTRTGGFPHPAPVDESGLRPRKTWNGSNIATVLRSAD